MPCFDDNYSCYLFTVEDGCNVEDGECKGDENIDEYHKCKFEFTDENEN